MVSGGVEGIGRVPEAVPYLPGRILAEFSTQTQSARRGAGARWTTLRITDAGEGRLFCEKVRGPAPLDAESKTVESAAELKTFFGGGWVARELLADFDPFSYPRWLTAA